MTFTLPPLPYGFEALEPHIDTQTMQIHYGKHHAAYVANLNKAIENLDIKDITIEELLANVSKYSNTVRNNGGGHYNHTMFWNSMSGHGGGNPSGKLLDAINSSFDSVENFKTLFNAAGIAQFGSGWIWLGVKENKLTICSTPNQDNPLMDIATCKCVPILGVDVWEHAYYLHYQNRRMEYLQAFWNVVNWENMSIRFNKL